MQNKYEKLFDDFLDLIEFSLIKINHNTWKLRDHQEANLGNIESEEFFSTMQIIDRLDIYINDYIIEPLIEGFENMNYNNIPSQWSDILHYGKKVLSDEYLWDLNVLDMIINHADKINLNNCVYE